MGGFWGDSIDVSICRTEVSDTWDLGPSEWTVDMDGLGRVRERGWAGVHEHRVCVHERRSVNMDRITVCEYEWDRV